MFQNVTPNSGISYKGRIWSVVWGDANGDNLPDLWFTRHNEHALTANALDGFLYINLGNGQFSDATTQKVEYLQRDMHGSTWVDFDNDGDKDLSILHAAKSGVTIFENNSGYLNDITTSLGFNLPEFIYGHNPLWFDYNNDGRLDLYFAGDRNPDAVDYYNPGSVVFRQTASGNFVDAGTEVGFTDFASNPNLADLDGDGRLELILTQYGKLTHVYSTTGSKWTDLRDSMFAGIDIPTYNDMIIADFNNDLRPDIYLTRSGLEDEVALGEQQIRSYIAEPRGQERGFSFETSGNLTFLFPRQDGTMDYSLIHVGAAGRNPITNDRVTSFDLSASDSRNIGIMPHTVSDPGIYIGYDPQDEQWHYEVVGRPRVGLGFPARGVIINSTTPIDNLQTQGLDTGSPAADQLLLNTVTATGATHFVDASAASGIAAMRIYGNEAAAGDFDNDGDIDIYVDQAGPALNRTNLLLENQGDGTFLRVFNVGASGAALGTGGPVALADYDQDGFLDIALANGGATPPYIPLNDDGPLQLFHNLGNDNHWLEIRLHGIQSNADAIGAKVIITAGGAQQLREAVNGAHVKAQDFQDLHFGLGQSQLIDRVQVHWPSGGQTTLRNVPVDDIIDIYENQGTSGVNGKTSFLEDTGTWTPAGIPAITQSDPGEEILFSSTLDDGDTADSITGADAMLSDSGQATDLSGVVLDDGSSAFDSGDWILA